MKFSTSNVRNKPKSKRIVIYICLILLLFATLLFVLEKAKITNFYTKKQTEIAQSGEQINYDPPTQNEQSAGDSQKEESINNQEERNAQVGQPEKAVSVIITDAAQYDNMIEVRAFIPDHYEDGTCKITFTSGSQKVIKEAKAYADSSTTICTNPIITRAEFPTAGTWNLVVTYSASRAMGSSAAKDVVIN